MFEICVCFIAAIPRLKLRDCAIWKIPALISTAEALQLQDVVQCYVNSSQLARMGLLRNPSSEFANMSLSQEDINALTAFLLALTEDYDDA